MYKSLYTGAMADIAISEFRRRCLKLLEHLPPEGLTVTKRGRAVAVVRRAHRSPVELIGSCPGLRVDAGDDLFSTGRRWDAESGHAHTAGRG